MPYAAMPPARVARAYKRPRSALLYQGYQGQKPTLFKELYPSPPEHPMPPPPLLRALCVRRRPSVGVGGAGVGPRDSRAILRLLCGPLSTGASSSGMRDVRPAMIRLYSRFASRSWSS